MQAVKIVVWQDGDDWLGYLQEYPDYWTQGESLDDLKEHLKDIYADLSGGAIPGARRVESRSLFRATVKSGIISHVGSSACSATMTIAIRGDRAPSNG